MNHANTIVALSSPVTSALRSIVRISGADAFALAARISTQDSLPLEHGRVARQRAVLGDGLAFDVTVYPFRAPRSSTGEDVIELHVPASPFLTGRVLHRLVELGARQAEPGEFTARAFFNGKLDLTSAEGVAATIASSNRAELNAARQLLGGELARRLAPILDQLVQTLALVEVGIDFTEEDVSFISRSDIETNLASAERALCDLSSEAPRIERLSHEPRIVLTGRPNAGKSTLLNALAGKSRAVVSDVAGTTRDALSARVALARGFVMLVDVAGIEDAGDDTISNQMQAAAQSQIAQADAVVLLIDVSDSEPPVALAREPDLVVYSKSDLARAPVGSLAIDTPRSTGLDALRARLDAIAFGATAGGSLALNARHVDAIQLAVTSVRRAAAASSAGAEVIAFELRSAIDHLGSILGSVSPDDVLGRIFSGFCIGK